MVSEFSAARMASTASLLPAESVAETVVGLAPLSTTNVFSVGTTPWLAKATASFTVARTSWKSTPSRWSLLKSKLYISMATTTATPAKLVVVVVVEGYHAAMEAFSPTTEMGPDATRAMPSRADRLKARDTEVAGAPPMSRRKAVCAVAWSRKTASPTTATEPGSSVSEKSPAAAIWPVAPARASCTVNSKLEWSLVCAISWL